jgi:hypothetical protein
MAEGARASASGCHVDRLPDSLLSNILARSAAFDASWVDAKRLCQMGLVSRRFQTLIWQAERVEWDLSYLEAVEAGVIAWLSDAENVRGLKLFHYYDSADQDIYKMSIGFLAGVLALAPRLTSFELNVPQIGVAIGSSALLANQLFQSLSNCSQLAELSIIVGTLNIRSPLCPRRRFEQLKKVELRCYYGDIADFAITSSDAWLSSLIANSPILESLTLEHLDGLQTPEINSASLTELSLNCAVDDSMLYKLSVNCPKLSVLSVETSLQIVINAPELKRLSIIHWFGDLGSIVRVSPWKVETLHISGGGDWKAKELQDLCGLCPNLAVLEADKPRSRGSDESSEGFCQSVDVHTIAKACKGIQELRILSSCITYHRAYVNIDGDLPKLPEFLKLKCLVVKATSFMVGFVDKCCRASFLCPCLEEIKLQCCTKDVVARLTNELAKYRPEVRVTVI